MMKQLQDMMHVLDDHGTSVRVGVAHGGSGGNYVTFSIEDSNVRPRIPLWQLLQQRGSMCVNMGEGWLIHLPYGTRCHILNWANRQLGYTRRRRRYQHISIRFRR